MEQALDVTGPAGRLSAHLLSPEVPRAAAVVAHPHPLMGGSMSSPVVVAVQGALAREGVAALRFDFRGIGRSQGHYDEGRGERDDVGACAALLARLHPGVPLVVVGYSFGSWVGLGHALRDGSVAAFLGIGMPVRMFDFQGIERLGRPLAAVQAVADEHGTPAEVRALLDRARPRGRVYVVDGCGHTFAGREEAAGLRAAKAAGDLLVALERGRGPEGTGPYR